MTKKISIYWLIPIIIISGIFGFYTSSYSFFNFKNEIDIISFISLVVTSSIGFYIASTLQKNLEAKKFEKELNLKIIKSILLETKTLESFLKENNLIFNETVSIFKQISSFISELNEINDICNVSDTAKIKELKDIFFELKPLITGSNLKEDKFLLSTEHKGLSKSKLKEFRKKLIMLMIETNRK